MFTVFFTSNTSWFLYNFRFQTIKAVVDLGYDVVCLAPEDEFSSRLVSELGARFIAVPLNGENVSVFKEVNSFFYVFKTVRKFRPAIVFNSTIKMNIYVGMACYLLNIPFVNNISGLGTAFIHEGWLFRRVRWLYGKINRRSLKLFFENEDDLEVFRDRGLVEGTPVTILPGSGVDLNRFEEADLPEPRPVTFIMVARLLGDKGVREYAKACQLLHSEGLDLRCLLVGPLGVSNRTAISEEEVAQWEEAGSLEYCGGMDDVRPLIEQSHVLVLPSYREGMPRTVLEAAAMGRPAIVTDVAGCRQSIEPDVTGWLCEVRNAESLAEQMRRVVEMDHTELQSFGRAARRRMEKMFSEELVVQAYVDCLP